MLLSSLLKQNLDTATLECWQRERTVQPRRVAVDETAVKLNDEWLWLYAAIDLDTTGIP